MGPRRWASQSLGSRAREQRLRRRGTRCQAAGCQAAGTLGTLVACPVQAGGPSVASGAAAATVHRALLLVVLLLACCQTRCRRRRCCPGVPAECPAEAAAQRWASNTAAAPPYLGGTGAQVVLRQRLATAIRCGCCGLRHRSDWGDARDKGISLVLCCSLRHRPLTMLVDGGCMLLSVRLRWIVCS